MAAPKARISAQAADHAKRPFLILRDDRSARFAELDAALSLAQQGHASEPTVTFVVCQIVATVEPEVTSKVTQHRL